MRLDFGGAIIARGHRTTSFWFMTLFLTISNHVVVAQDGESLASSFFSGSTQLRVAYKYQGSDIDPDKEMNIYICMYFCV